MFAGSKAIEKLPLVVTNLNPTSQQEVRSLETRNKII